MNYKTMLAKILSKEELANMNLEIIKEDKRLLNELSNKNYLMILDWSGEFNEGDLFNFINGRLSSMLGKKLDLPEKEVYQLYNNKSEKERGDFPPFAFDYFDKYLKSVGARLALLNLECDSYFVIVAYEKDAEKLKKIKSDFWKFRLIEQKCKNVLYSVTCPKCGNGEVWELTTDIDEKELAGEGCGNCNTLFWDEDGNELVEVEKTYY